MCLFLPPSFFLIQSSVSAGLVSQGLSDYSNILSGPLGTPLARLAIWLWVALSESTSAFAAAVRCRRCGTSPDSGEEFTCKSCPCGSTEATAAGLSVPAAATAAVAASIGTGLGTRRCVCSCHRLSEVLPRRCTECASEPPGESAASAGEHLTSTESLSKSSLLAFSVMLLLVMFLSSPVCWPVCLIPSVLIYFFVCFCNPITLTTATCSDGGVCASAFDCGFQQGMLGHQPAPTRFANIRF